jgi:hypothetical protein
VDYDGDGMLDIIVGDRNGYIHFYRRTSEAPVTLTKEADIVCGGVTIDVGYNAAPVCADWDEDGERDLLVGTQGGEVRLYHNDTIDTDPVYNTYTFLESSGTAINHYRNCPQVLDMNQDGKKDLLCGANDNKIYYYENTGTNAEPVFSGSESIINTGSSGARFWVDDWNEDGMFDVLASNYNGFVQVYIQQSTGMEETEGIGLQRELTADGNPFYSSVTIGSQGFGQGILTVYDMSGRALLTEPFSGSFLLNGSDLARGCYIVEVRDAEGADALKLMKL